MKVPHIQWVVNTCPALLGSKGVSTGVALRQRVQQRLGLLQVRRVKALGEPAVDWGQEVMGFLAFALLLPELCQTGSRSQLEGPCLLGSGNLKGVMETALSFRVIGCILL